MLRIKIAVRERKELFKVFIRKLRREIMLNTIIRKNNFINGRKRLKKWKRHGKIDFKLRIKNYLIKKRFSKLPKYIVIYIKSDKRKSVIG